MQRPAAPVPGRTVLQGGGRWAGATAVANRTVNEAYLRTAIEAAAALCQDQTPHKAVLAAIAEGDYPRQVGNALTADPEKFRLYYAGLCAEVLAGRPRVTDLRRLINRYGY
jgi:hypothetical protein